MNKYGKHLLQSPLLWILLFSAIAYYFIVVPQWSPTWDSAIYISLARAMVNGEGYTYMGYPHTKYPPGFSLLLAPIEFIAGHNFLYMRLLIAICAVGSIGLTFLLIRRTASVSVACAVSLMTAASYALFIETTHILSDVPYMFVSLAALIVAERYSRHLSMRYAFMTIGLIATAFMIRLVGFTLALSLVPVILISARRHPVQKRIRHAVLVLGVIALVAGVWMGRNALITDNLPPGLRESLSYERELIVVNPDNPRSETVTQSDLVERVGRNMAHYEKMFVDLLTAKRVTNRFFVHLFIALWLTGWLLALFFRHTVIEYYTLFYMLVYLLWPAWQGERFLIPILPMIFYYALQPFLLFFQDPSDRFALSKDKPWLHNIISWLRPIQLRGQNVSSSRTALLIFLTVAVISLNALLVIPFIKKERQVPYYTGFFAEYIGAIEWLRDNTPEDAIIIADPSPWVYLLSERKSFTSPWVPDHQKVLDSISLNGGTHVVSNNWGYTSYFLKPVLRMHPERFREIHQIGGNIIYEIQ